MNYSLFLVAIFLVLFCVPAKGITIHDVSCGSCYLWDLHWEESKVAWALTADAQVMRSGDDGLTWTTQFSAHVFEIFPSNRSWVILYSLANLAVWYTQDAGVSYRSRTLPFDPDFLRPHPSKLGWIVGKEWCINSNCGAYYSTDFGETWHNLGAGYIRQVQWSMDPDRPDIVYIVNTEYQYGYLSINGGGITYMFSNAVGFVQHSHYLYVGVGVAADKMDLYVSASITDPTHTDKGKFREVLFPFGADLATRGFNFLDFHKSVVFLGVDHAKVGGSLQVSQYAGSRFIQSMDDAVTYDLYFDFDRATDAPGTYVVNRYDSPYGGRMKTYITFDNGGEWRLLTAPTTDSQGRPITCPGCSLHLHGLTSQITQGFAPFYSSENAVGLIVAVGNVGQELDTDVQNLNTFLSRDNGLTWKEIAQGSTIYEFGDHGGILIYARNDIGTNTIYYSLDEGATFRPFKFSIDEQMVWNIISERSGASRNFLLWTEDSRTNFHWYTLDFSDQQPKICTDSDYEEWSPSDGRHGSSSCIMGVTTVYSRRKPNAPCFNNRDTEHQLREEPCACTWEDYECDYGFVPSARNTTNGFTCFPAPGTIWPPEDPPTVCPAGTYYEVPTGYNIVTDNGCKGGLNINPLVKQCGKGDDSMFGDNVGKKVAIALGVIVAVGVVAVIVFTLVRKPELLEQITEKIKGVGPSKYRKVSMMDDTDEPVGDDAEPI